MVTLEGYMGRLISERRFTMALLGIFGIMGLTIAAAGIFSMMAYVVAQRTGEIGICMALGSTPARVVLLVLKRAVPLTLAGLAIGVAGAWYLSATVQAYLFQLDATDGRVLAAALALLGCVALLASLIPARRAARVDPVIAIRVG